MAGNDDVTIRVGADLGALDAALSSAQSTIRSFASGTQSALSSIGNSLQAVEGAFSTAFAATGILVAYEAVVKLGGAVKELAERAVEIKTLSDTIGISVEQFQAMQVVAEESGVKTTTMARASEKLAETLFEARNGSGAAIATLSALGITAEQLNNPLFTVNELMTNLHERLNDNATAQSTHNELMRLFGLRMATAIEAIAKYNGSQDAVKKTIAEVNGLTKEQTADLEQELGTYSKLATYLENTVSKAYLTAVHAASDFMAVVFSPAASSPALAGIFGSGGPAAQAQATVAAMEVVTVNARQFTEQDLLAMKMQVDATKAGTEERIAALKRFAEAEQQFYKGQPVEAVRQTNVEILTAERELTDRRKAFLDEWASYYTEKSLQIQTREEERDARIANQDNELLRQQKAFIDEWTAYYQQQTIKNVTAETEQNAKVLRAQNEVTKSLEQQWKRVTDSIGNAFGNAISSMLMHTQSFGNAMRSLFASVFNDIIDGLARMAVQWVANTLIARTASKTAAGDEVASNAAVAATGAGASVASIPFWGWAAAAGVMAATFALAKSYSAEGGFDVPAGMSPVTQLHPNEMVLPAPYAEVIRSLAATNAAGNGSGSGDTFHFNVHTMDAAGVKDFLSKPGNRSAIAHAMRQHVSRGGR